MSKSTLYRNIMNEVQNTVSSMVDHYIKENEGTGELSFDKDYEMFYIVEDIFGELGGNVLTIIENELEDSGDLT